jgi:hypothetical protein
MPAKIPDDLIEFLKRMEIQLSFYYSAINMAIELLETHEPHATRTIQLYETMLVTIDSTIKDIHEKLDTKPARK